MAFSYLSNCFAALVQYGRVWPLIIPMIVACNDTSAYVWGMSFGRTKLIALSPNKTMEGFVGNRARKTVQNKILTDAFHGKSVLGVIF